MVALGVEGKLSESLRRIQCLYAAWFNRTRGETRTGHLFDARFRSFPIQSESYLLAVFPYIDLNPVRAGLVKDPLDYAYGSAAAHAGLVHRPSWLCKGLVNELLEDDLARGLDRAEAYRRVFCLESPADAFEVVGARLRHGGTESDELDILLGSDPNGQLAWLRKMALEADGTRVSPPMVASMSVLVVCAELRAMQPEALLPAGRGQSRSLWDTLEAGLLRDLAGLPLARVGALQSASASCAARRTEAHRRAMLADESYALVAADAARRALLRCYGPEIGRKADSILRRRLTPKTGASS
jgi:hypothetical protein